MASLQTSISHLRLILWKNLRMRLHYPIIAVLEFLVPIIIFHQGLNFRHVFETSTIKNTTVFPPEQHTILYDPFLNSSTTILYTPKNDFTISITNAIKDKINPYEIIDIQDERSLVSTMANQSFIHERRDRSSWKAFGIMFQSKENDLKFSYKILTYNFMLNKDTRTLFSDDFAVATDKEDDYLTSGFLGLQFSIDRAFIMKKSDEESNFYNITIQKFPYPEYLSVKFPENIIYWLTLTGFVFLALTIPYYIATERHTGMKEIMKMMGISEFTIWFGWITYSLMIYPIVITIVVIILKTGITADPFYENIDAILLWMILILYCIANMTFLFSIGTLMNKHWVAIVTSVVICFLTAVNWLTSMTNEYDGDEIRIVAVLLLCFIPNLVLYNAFKALQYFEMKGHYTGWSSLVTNIMDPQILHLRTIIIYFILNIFLNGLIITFVSGIHPGKFGHRKHPLFMLMWFVNIFRCKKEVKVSEIVDDDNEYIEPVDNKRLGLQIRNLQKRFGYFSPFFALKDIDLNLLKDEITVVLGHNGAGKTTLLNVLSGMLFKTSGEIHYFENGTAKDSIELDGKIGFCSQHTIYFKYLTVEEHILFCGMARGMSELKASREAYNLLSLFDMQEKSGNMIHELSGGMQKKLSLLIAVIGRPEILILDEPTSGMDVYSRRMTWDLLKKMKENRIVIITTQDMEEADMIGDRIAIMHDGQIFCYGTPLFLKTLFGTGYNLILAKGPGYSSETTTKLIKNIVPSASIIKDSETTAKYNLPILATSQFSSLFEALEYHLKKLAISSIQMFCTTMDQVFVNWKNKQIGRLMIQIQMSKFLIRAIVNLPNFLFSVTFLAGKDTDRQVATTLPKIDEVQIEQRTGPFLMLCQLAALFSKKLKLSYRRYIRFFSCIVLTLVLGFTNIKTISWAYLIFGNLHFAPLNLSISTYRNAEVLLYYQGKTAALFVQLYEQYVSDKNGFVSRHENKNVTQGLLEYSQYNLYEFRDNVVAAMEITDNKYNVLYNELIPHSAPISLNTYSNGLLVYLTKNRKSSIETVYQPIAVARQETYCGVTTIEAFTVAAFWWILIFHSAIIALFVFLISFIISERIHGIKHIQTMSNLPEFTYWLGNFIFDYFAYVVVITLTIAIMSLTDSDKVFPFSDMKILLWILLLYGVCGLLYSYVFASLFDSISMFMLINILINVSCLATLTVVKQEESSLFYPLRTISALLPPFTFLNILTRFLYILINNNQCVYCMHWEIENCESKREIMDFYTANVLGTKFPETIQEFLRYLIMDIFIYGPLLILINSNFSAWSWNSFITYIFGKESIIDPNELAEEDHFVLAEKKLIEHIFTNDMTTDHALLVYNLKKNLILNGFQKFSPVADVNFFVSKGSCFGVVGINGAGKSTIMKVLTTFLLPTDGDVRVYNKSMRKNIRKYTSMIGYCPQSNAIFEELTGREMLLLTATLKGLKKPEEHVKNWIMTFDLERYQNNLIETYSTGSKRKLCTALSLIGNPVVVFLDEPTTGVDPLARQLLYKMIKGRKRSGQSIVIATHGLKECEILCDRVTVLQNGILKRIGSVSLLKKQYAGGFTLLVKLHSIMNISDKTEALIDGILKAFKNDNCFLKDQRVGLLHFRILNEELRWSELFGIMERIKNQYETVQEYIITNTTVEEVFLSSHENF